MSHASYLTHLFNRNKQTKVISGIRKLIKEKQLEFDGFIVTGVSGVAMGAMVARSLKKDLVIIRKVNDNSHSSYHVENFKHGKNYIFFDDLIASGNTYRKVRKEFDICHSKEWQYGEKSEGLKSKIIGTILYNYSDNENVKFLSNQQIGKYTKRGY
jgi:hypothetical protein